MSTDFTHLHYAYILRVSYKSNFSFMHWKGLLKTAGSSIQPSDSLLHHNLWDPCKNLPSIFLILIPTNWMWFLTLLRDLQIDNQSFIIFRAEAVTEITTGKQVYSSGNYHHGCYEAYFKLVFPIKRFVSVEKIGRYMESYFLFNLIQNYFY